MAYYQQPYGAPPPQPDLWGWFCAVDTDRSGKIAPKELQKALSNGFSEFNIETVQLLMNMFDRDHSGKITFEEFQNLFGFINQWRGIFMQYDRDRYDKIYAANISFDLPNWFKRTGFLKRYQISFKTTVTI